MRCHSWGLTRHLGTRPVEKQPGASGGGVGGLLTFSPLSHMTQSFECGLYRGHRGVTGRACPLLPPLAFAGAQHQAVLVQASGQPPI